MVQVPSPRRWNTCSAAGRSPNGVDLVIGIPFKFGVGYSLTQEDRVCAWGGTGGCCVIIDVDRRITFAYVMNKMAPGGGTIAKALAERVSGIVKR
jgi:hypothetical protein